MQTLVKSFFPYLLLYLSCASHFSACSTHSTAKTPKPISCTELKQQNLNTSSHSTSILLCKSNKVYFRTTLGLLQVSSIDYEAQTFTVSRPSCSSSHRFISPSLLTAGFRPPTKPNSLLLFNCYRRENPMSSFLQNCSYALRCGAQKRDLETPFPCLLVDDSGKLDSGFHPKDLKCSHYRRALRSSSSPSFGGFEGGTRVSFGIPDHIPNACDECSKPNGNCGIGLRCICHPKECKEKIISGGLSLEPLGKIYLILLLVSCSALMC